MSTHKGRRILFSKDFVVRIMALLISSNDTRRIGKHKFHFFCTRNTVELHFVNYDLNTNDIGAAVMRHCNFQLFLFTSIVSSFDPACGDVVVPGAAIKTSSIFLEDHRIFKGCASPPALQPKKTLCAYVTFAVRC